MLLIDVFLGKSLYLTHSFAIDRNQNLCRIWVIEPFLLMVQNREAVCYLVLAEDLY